MYNKKKDSKKNPSFALNSIFRFYIAEKWKETLKEKKESSNVTI